MRVGWAAGVDGVMPRRRMIFKRDHGLSRLPVQLERLSVSVPCRQPRPPHPRYRPERPRQLADGRPDHRASPGQGSWPATGKSSGKTTTNACIAPAFTPNCAIWCRSMAKGIMSAPEAPDWTPESPARPNLKPGASSWTMTGEPCGPRVPEPDRRTARKTAITSSRFIPQCISSPMWITSARSGWSPWARNTPA